MVADIWEAMKRSKPKPVDAEGSSKQEENEVVEPEAIEEEKEDEEEGQDAGNHMEEGVDDPVEAEREETETEDETAKLVQLAVQAILLSQKQVKEKESKLVKEKSAPGDKKNPRKRGHSSQGSQSGRTLRSKRGR